MIDILKEDTENDELLMPYEPDDDSLYNQNEVSILPKVMENYEPQPGKVPRNIAIWRKQN